MNVFVSKMVFLIFFIGLVIFSVWITIKGFVFLLPFILAYWLANPLSKLVTYLSTRLKIPKAFLSLLVVLSVIFILFGSSGFLIYRFVRSFGDFNQYAKSISDNFNQLFTSANQYTIMLPWKDDPIVLSSLILEFYNVIIIALTEAFNQLASLALSFIKTLPAVGLFIFFMFLSLYFFTKDYDRIQSAVRTTLTRIESDVFHSVKDRSFQMIKNYFKAQFILSSITFIISLIGLSLLKIPFSPIIAFIIAIVDFIPMLGPASVYVPWIIFQLVVSHYQLAASLGVIYLIATSTRQIIEPKIVSDKIGVYPLITIMSMYVSYRILGVIGLILGPILVMFSIIIKHAYDDVKNTNIPK